MFNAQFLLRLKIHLESKAAYVKKINAKIHIYKLFTISYFVYKLKILEICILDMANLLIDREREQERK